MKKHISIVLINILLIGFTARADEGMWLINMLGQMNIEKLYEKGLELTPEQIYDVNNSSLKDAVVAINYGMCTGEFVSNKGLILTNHHCAHDDVQEISSLEQDYLNNGFWAKSMEEEIPIKGKTISVLYKVEDITKKVQKLIKEETKAGRDNSFMMRRIYHDIEREMNKESGYETSVASMYGGNQYFLFYYTIYKDVRLVGVPPLSIGYFGGETDNWMWPQHKGDFAFYRAYASKDGKPAEYSEDNVPLEPKNFLKISLKGVNDGDYAMTLGYPYSIDRYLSSYGLEELINILNPAQIAVREKKLGIMKEAMNKDHKVQIQYSSKYFNSANYYKYAIGENKYVKAYDVLNLKRKTENDFKEWYSNKNSREKKYGSVLEQLKTLYAKKANYEKTEKYYQEGFVKGSDMLQFSLRGKGWESTLEKNPSKKSLEKKIKLNRKAAKDFFKDYHFETDKKLFAAGIKLYIENVDPAHVSETLRNELKRFNNDYEKYADYVYANSMFSTADNFEKFLSDPSIEKLQNDPAYKVVQPTLEIIFKLREEHRPYQAEIRKQQKLFIEGLLEMNKGKGMYPDANSTMRLSYGTVGGYSPRDAVDYDYYTTIDGYLEKENIEDPEFIIDNDFKDLVKSNDFGQYSDENGNLVVDFLTNNDITGGSSGSPVLNGKGELIGVAFDGNWESMAGGVYFHPYFNKTVCVDIRFVLFVVDKFANAQNIMSELELAK
ncbi:MAG: S46 family peptidase [Bacteroidetes bacterium]|nr:S46 family peptidase [Bacteroidota bacterium]